MRMALSAGLMRALAGTSAKVSELLSPGGTMNVRRFTVVDMYCGAVGDVVPAGGGDDETGVNDEDDDVRIDDDEPGIPIIT